MEAWRTYASEKVLLEGELDVGSLLDHFEDLEPSVTCARVSELI
jgi:hypothetical protein